MTDTKMKRQPPSKQQRAMSAAIFGLIWGGIGGALIAASLSRNTAIGAVLGALIFGVGEAVTDWTRQPGAPKPLFWRILGAVLTGAMVGSLLELFTAIQPAMAGLFLGMLTGLFSFRRLGFLLGTTVGLLAGLLAAFFYPDLNVAILGGLVVFIFRLLSAWLFRDQEWISVAAERVPISEVRYVVPFEANSNYIGADYFQDLARMEGGAFQRNAPDIGIVESMENLRGPHFDPEKVDPLIREFYEHTTRFKLSIIPVWKEWMKPLFWFYKRAVAQQMGQANLPFNQEEALEGVVSYIDTIDFQCNDIIDLRGWVRAFEKSGEAIYVGIYTTFQHENVGYVSVGFPLPDSNFTATLLPYNVNGRHFLLKSRDTELPYPGHYFSTKEEENITVLGLPTFHEEIEVYVDDGQLKTDHRFYLGRQNFLTLYYTIERAGQETTI